MIAPALRQTIHGNDLPLLAHPARLLRSRALRRPGARGLLETWQSEFERILNGRQGEVRRKIAEAFVNDFLELPATDPHDPACPQPFRMGTTPEKQGATAGVRQLWQREVASHESAEEVAKEKNILFSRWAREQEQLTNEFIGLLQIAFDEDDLEPLFDRYSPADETPQQDTQRRIEAFGLARRPTTNATIRLFDPDFGQRSTPLFEAYTTWSDSPDCPAVERFVV